MKNCFKRYLFNKFILVSEKKGRNPLETMVLLAENFQIKITAGQELVNEDMIPFVADSLGKSVPDAFYRGFPESVRKLTKNELLFDQLLHYTVTYGFGDFSEPGHSVFEEDFDRLLFAEKPYVKNYVVLSEEAATAKIQEYVEDMLKSTRPLNLEQLEFVKSFIEETQYKVQSCACKDTAIELLVDTKDLYYTKFITLADVIRLVDTINYKTYHNSDIRLLNFRNQDRKLVTKVLDAIFDHGYCNERDCFEKKAVWCGLLHHIHYQPKTKLAQNFVAAMRGKENRSVYSEFERAMAQKDIRRAVTVLLAGKGQGALLRNLNYILSRCQNDRDVEFVLDSLQVEKPILWMQLLLQYVNYVSGGARTFLFAYHYQLKMHEETEEEEERRKSVLPAKTVEYLMQFVQGKLRALLRGRLQKVYIDPKMYSYALPLQETTSNGGYGVLPKGTRLPMEQGKKIRAFTYWEKVDDIDLSVIGLSEDGQQTEFSWRTMAGRNSGEITYSGDQTAGYNGGSEYFDIDVALFKKKRPDIRYLVFCDNVYSDQTFQNCVCRAGYMLRDVRDSGEIFEPKTVRSSFTVTADSRFAFLFGIDLKTNEFVWLNVGKSDNRNVAGESNCNFLLPYFSITSVLNVGNFFEMLSSEVVTDPQEADVVVSDEECKVREGATVIHSYDFEKLLALMNG